MFDLTSSTTKDLQDVGVLFLRKQCSIGVLRVNFDKAATRLRWASPGVVEILRSYIDEMDAISRRPPKEQFLAMSALLGRFDRWVKDGAKPAPAAQPERPQPAAPAQTARPEAPPIVEPPPAPAAVIPEIPALQAGPTLVVELEPEDPTSEVMTSEVPPPPPEPVPVPGRTW